MRPTQRLEMTDIERARRTEEVAAAERDRVQFILEPVGGPRYLLRNDGTASAFGVHVEAGDLAYEGHVADIEEFPAGDYCEYCCALLTTRRLMAMKSVIPLMS